MPCQCSFFNCDKCNILVGDVSNSGGYVSMGASHVALVEKNPPANVGDVRDVSSIPGSERSLGGGHGNLPQYSCLENPMDTGAWWATVHAIRKNQGMD